VVKAREIDLVAAELRAVGGEGGARPFDGPHEEQLLAGRLVERRPQPAADLRQQIDPQVLILQPHLPQRHVAGVASAFVHDAEGLLGLLDPNGLRRQPRGVPRQRRDRYPRQSP
jgi:hypothetical protein